MENQLTEQKNRSLKLKQAALVIIIVLMAFLLRIWELGESGLQNDEQIWHERSARFIQSIFGPFAPEDMKIPEVFWAREHVDMTEGMPYPFTIKMPTIHPGTPASFAMGLCYVFFADDSSSWSLNWGSIIEVTRYPGVIFGTLMVLLLYWGGRQIVGHEAALIAMLIAAVEPLLVGYSRLARIDLSGALWVFASFICFIKAYRSRSWGFSILSGMFAALALATNTYGAFLIPSFFIIRNIYTFEEDKRYSHHCIPILFLIFMVGCLVAAFIFSPFIIELFDNNPPLSEEAIQKIKLMQKLFLLAGGACFCLSVVIFLSLKWIPSLQRPASIPKVGRIDIAWLIAWIVIYILAYPNLWPNPIKGIGWIINYHLELPHVVGEKSENATISHFFYMIRSPMHLLPWTLGLTVIGMIRSLRPKYLSREMVSLFVWAGITLLLFSIPPGRKSTKNFLQLLPFIFLMSGVGCHVLINGINTLIQKGPRVVYSIGLGSILLIVGIAVTFSWMPYPALYTWPWCTDPQTLEQRELVAVGEGIKEATEYVMEHGDNDDVIGVFAGKNVMDYYYPPSKVVGPYLVEDLKKMDWLVVVPKYTFVTSDENSLVRWIRNHEPDVILRHHQIELARLFHLNAESKEKTTK